jgi:hypothetical protein
MKKITFLTLMLFLTASVFAQNTSFKVTNICAAISTPTTNSGWSDWTKWEAVNYKISVIPAKKTIMIETFTADPLELYPYEYSEFTDGDGSFNMLFSCVDDNDIKCSIRFKIHKSTEIHAILTYPTLFKVTYNCVISTISETVKESGQAI